MFTGIIESTGKVLSIEKAGTNSSFWIESPVSEQLKIDQSVSHNGVCLTVEATGGGAHKVTAIEETLKKTNLGSWEKDSLINLERCMQMNGRLDGHLVQGHVDTTATCVGKKDEQGSWEYRFKTGKKFENLMIEKGSICINGISLTLFDVSRKEFSVAIIPYTFANTNIGLVNPGDTVNIEFDLIGKYISRYLANSAKHH